jgi:hypothetical protein
MADNTCLTAPNNVPLTVVQQSPIFTPTRFVMGGTDLGTTQYLDAHLRASFWNLLGSGASDYHVLLDPIHVEQPVVLDVPSNEGLAITDPQFLAAFGFTICAPVQLIDFFWFNSYLRGTIFPGLTNVDQASLPIFLAHEAQWAYGVDNLFNCCLPSWHSVIGYPIETQSFVVATFDKTNFFSGPPGGYDTGFLSQDMGNWETNPLVEGFAPPWTIQEFGLSACEDYAEVGDALAFTHPLPPIVGANGFHYRLHELAFLPWFFGLPSMGLNGWFSLNGTFLSDAGPVCPSS